MYRSITTLLSFCAISLLAPFSALGVTINTVPVGSAGNANDTTGFGSVAYGYRIGTYEVTNSQYVEFLNTKAKSDPLGLYNTNMGSDARGGITQSGVSGSFTYAAKTDMGNKPVNYVSWYDSIRFTNWLNNGQGTGDTEGGAYTILGGTPTPSNAATITRTARSYLVFDQRERMVQGSLLRSAHRGARRSTGRRQLLAVSHVER